MELDELETRDAVFYGQVRGIFELGNMDTEPLIHVSCLTQ